MDASAKWPRVGSSRSSRPPCPHRRAILTDRSLRCRRRAPEASEAAAAERQVIVGDMGVDEVVARNYHAAPPELERVEVEPSGQLVERGLDREDHLAQPVAAERAG